MNKNKKIVLVLVGILILVGAFFIYNQNTQQAIKEAQTPIVSENYKVFNEAELTFADTGKVILFFKASWCPSCRTLDRDIKQNVANIPQDLKILEIDFDNSTELRQKYGITSQHTLVQVDSMGNMINKWSGGNTLDSIITQVQ